ncbi:hypothetical protein KCU65_g9024, partial [Aureobasidium melanogenum]
MGRLSHESTRSSIDTSLENGEGLPLYSDITVTSPGELTAPEEEATPDEVREFLNKLLVQNRGLHPDHARRVASKWTLGTGRELTTYPPQLYAEIFGLEDAWMVYKEAKLFMRMEKKKKEKVPGIVVAIIILTMILLCSIMVAIFADGENTLKWVGVAVSFVGGIAWFMVVMIALFDKTTEEQKLENELKIYLVTKSKD